MKAFGGESEPDSQRHQLLLDAVVEVLLDALSLGVRRGHYAAGHPRSRRPRKPREKADTVLVTEIAAWLTGAVRRGRALS